MNVENSMNRNVAAGNKTGSLGNLAVGAWLGGIVAGKRRGNAGGNERSAEDWANQDLFEQRQHERGMQMGVHNTALDMTKTEHKSGTEVGAVKDLHNFFADKGYTTSSLGHGSTKVNVNAPKPSTASQGTSGVKKGAQFNKPMPAFSVAGPSGKRQPNPEYRAWKGERDTFNAQATAGNVQPVGLAAKPGKAPTTPKAPKA